MSKEYAEKLEKDNKWKEALNVYEGLLDNDENGIEIQAKIGWCQSRLQQYSDAIQTFTHICKLEPKNARWPYMVGYQYYSMKNWNHAIEWFKRALDLYPDYFTVKYRLAYALTRVCGSLFRLKKAEYLEAMHHLKECQQLWSKMSSVQKSKNRSIYADVCFQQGKIYIEREDWDNANKCLKTAIEINPNSFNSKYQYAKSLCKSGRFEEASKFLPKDESKYYVKELKAEILAGLNKHNEALSILLDCIKRRKRDYLLRQIALIYLQLNNKREALMYAMKAININKENHKNHFVLARILFCMGLLLKAKNEAKLADELSIKKYDIEFHEAKSLLQAINVAIAESKYNNDDEKILKEIMLQKRKHGVIKKYNTDKGYGFIESNNKSYFFHITDIPIKDQKQVIEGLHISFEEKESPKGMMALNITID